MKDSTRSLMSAVSSLPELTGVHACALARASRSHHNRPACCAALKKADELC